MDTSTPDNLAARIAALSPEKRALLERKLKQQSGLHSKNNTISRRTTPTPPPLSFAQQRLWFLDQLEPNSALYNISSVVRLQGIFHIEAFRQALAALVMRHETLRTTFPAIDGTPYQVIAEQPVLHMNVVDLRSWAESERESEALRLVTEESQQPFNLAQGPLVRALVVQSGAEEHLLALTMHHIISDGWSRNVLFRELATLYESIVSGQEATLPELRIHYGDFAIWQRGWLQGQELEKQLRYWKKQLQRAPSVLQLPTDRPRPIVQSYRGANSSRLLPKELCAQLHALSREEKVTLFMTLLATFQILLYRYTNQEDIVVGSPIAGRNRDEVEHLIGFFVNTLVLRTHLSNNPTFRDVLKQVRETALEAYAHQDIPFELLVKELQPHRDLSRTPLVQVVFAYQNILRQGLELHKLKTSHIEVSSGTA